MEQVVPEQHVGDQAQHEAGAQQREERPEPPAQRTERHDGEAEQQHEIADDVRERDQAHNRTRRVVERGREEQVPRDHGAAERDDRRVQKQGRAAFPVGPAAPQLHEAHEADDVARQVDGVGQRHPERSVPPQESERQEHHVTEPERRKRGEQPAPRRAQPRVTLATRPRPGEEDDRGTQREGAEIAEQRDLGDTRRGQRLADCEARGIETEQDNRSDPHKADAGSPVVRGGIGHQPDVT